MQTDLNKNNLRRRLVLLCGLFIVAFFIACEDRREEASSPAAQQPLENYPYEGTIIAVGDSLTAGIGVREEEAYPALLEKKIQQDGYHWRVVNAGISGETSSGTLSRINWIAAQHPDIVILETGANDGLRGIPTALVKENISQIVQRLQEKDIDVILAGMQIVQNLGAEYTRDFAAIYPAVAAEKNIPLIPFFLEEVAGTASLNQPDSIHPTAEGYRIVTGNVYPYVLKAVKQRMKNKASAK